MSTFIERNRVLITALISAVVLVGQQALADKEYDWKAIGFAALIAVIGVIGNQFKGQGITILGILATLCGTFTTIWSTGVFTVNEFILSSIVAVLMTVSASLQPKNIE